MAIGVVLSQASHPLVFYSKKMGHYMRSASTYEREMFEITFMVKKWCHYLLERHFHIYTDQQSL